MAAEAREEARRARAHASQNANNFMFKKRNQKTMRVSIKMCQNNKYHTWILMMRVRYKKCGILCMFEMCVYMNAVR